MQSILGKMWKVISHYLVSVTAGGPESPRAHVAKFYGQLRLICSVWEHQNCLLNMIEIVILWVYYTIPFGFIMEHLQRVWHASRERLPFRTPGSVPHFGTCQCSNCWDQIPRTCHVFTRLFTSNTPWYFLGFACFGNWLASFFKFLNYFVWLRITDEGSVPDMRIWSILLIKSDIKWCIHLSRSLFLYS